MSAASTYCIFHLIDSRKSFKRQNNAIASILRFLHRSDHLNLDAPIAELLSAKEDDGETPKEIGMDVLFKGLPQTKKNKNLKKALTVKPAVKGRMGSSVEFI